MIWVYTIAGCFAAVGAVLAVRGAVKLWYDSTPNKGSGGFYNDRDIPRF
jgi:hypothetical protein